jgi:hypothetical protein
MDLPISMLNWELFLPERYQVKDFGGDVISAGLLPETFREETSGTGGGGGIGSGAAIGTSVGGLVDSFYVPDAGFPGQLGGIVLDPSGAVVSGARVSLTNSATGATIDAITNSAGRWIVSNFPSGAGKLRVEANGFQKLEQSFNYDASRSAQYVSKLSLGGVTETIEVSAQSVNAPMNARNYQQLAQLESNAKKQIANPSANVVNLQRRVAGVLPVAIDVPRTGTSFQFARALVLDEETKVTFSYKSR